MLHSSVPHRLSPDAGSGHDLLNAMFGAEQLQQQTQQQQSTDAQVAVAMEDEQHHAALPVRALSFSSVASLSDQESKEASEERGAAAAAAGEVEMAAAGQLAALRLEGGTAFSIDRFLTGLKTAVRTKFTAPGQAEQILALVEHLFADAAAGGLPMHDIVLVSCRLVGYAGVYECKGEATRANRTRKPGMKCYLSSMDSGKHAHVMREAIDLVQRFKELFPVQPLRTKDADVEKMHGGLPILIDAGLPAALLQWCVKFPQAKAPTSTLAAVMARLYATALAAHPQSNRKRKRSESAVKLPTRGEFKGRLPCFWLAFLAEYGHLLTLTAADWLEIVQALHSDHISVPPCIQQVGAGTDPRMFVAILIMSLKIADDQRLALLLPGVCPLTVSSGSDSDDASSNSGGSTVGVISPRSDSAASASSAVAAMDLDAFAPQDESAAFNDMFVPGLVVESDSDLNSVADGSCSSPLSFDSGESERDLSLKRPKLVCALHSLPDCIHDTCRAEQADDANLLSLPSSPRDPSSLSAFELDFSF